MGKAVPRRWVTSATQSLLPLAKGLGEAVLPQETQKVTSAQANKMTFQQMVLKLRTFKAVPPWEVTSVVLRIQVRTNKAVLHWEITSVVLEVGCRAGPLKEQWPANLNLVPKSMPKQLFLHQQISLTKPCLMQSCPLFSNGQCRH